MKIQIKIQLLRTVPGQLAPKWPQQVLFPLAAPPPGPTAPPTSQSPPAHAAPAIRRNSVSSRSPRMLTTEMPPLQRMLSGKRSFAGRPVRLKGSFRR